MATLTNSPYDSYSTSVKGAPMILAHILLITDEPEAGALWSHALQQRNYDVTLCTKLQQIDEKWQNEAFDIVIIDFYTSQYDGIALLARLRRESVIPIVMLVQGVTEAYQIDAYRVGVDECISKPIGVLLFLSKVQTWLRHSWVVPSDILSSFTFDGIRLDTSQRQWSTADGHSVKLTNLEFRLLYLLMRHPRQALESTVIIKRVWGYEGGDTVILKNLVYRLRRKIEPDASQPRYIHSVAGEGYMFQP
jgi:DNA-binding response OmpR family regulator